jgi:TRAP-type C4-dicarboxylate transport system permease small subunit
VVINLLERLENGIARFEKWIINIAFVVMLVAIFLQVCFRFVGLPLMGTVDIGLLCICVLTFIGFGLAVYTKDHITIEATDLLRSPKLRKGVHFLSVIFMLVFCMVFLALIYPFFMYTVESGEKTIELGIPLVLPIGALLVGVVLAILHSAIQLFLMIKEMRPGKSGGEL